MRFSLSSFPEAPPHSLERVRRLGVATVGYGGAGRGGRRALAAKGGRSRAGRATRPEAMQLPSAGGVAWWPDVGRLSGCGGAAPNASIRMVISCSFISFSCEFPTFLEQARRK